MRRGRIGPSFKWWNTGAPGEGRSKDRKVAAAVMVWKDLGKSGRSIFDIKRVRLVYEVGTMHRVDPASVAAMSVKRTSDKQDPASVRPSAADATDLGVPRLRDAPEFPAVEEPSPEPGVEAPGAEPSPEPGVEAPGAEPSPEPGVEAPGAGRRPSQGGGTRSPRPQRRATRTRGSASSSAAQRSECSRSRNASAGRASARRVPR